MSGIFDSQETTTEDFIKIPRPFGEFTDDDRVAWMKNPLYKTHRIKGDFTFFYATIGVCTILGLSLFLLNIFFCWCSKHKDYWRDSNTGNRWIFAIWTKTPYQQPPLDLTELEETAKSLAPTQVYDTSEAEQYGGYPRDDYLELQKRESDL